MEPLRLFQFTIQAIDRQIGFKCSDAPIGDPVGGLLKRIREAIGSIASAIQIGDQSYWPRGERLLVTKEAVFSEAGQLLGQSERFAARDFVRPQDMARVGTTDEKQQGAALRQAWRAQAALGLRLHIRQIYLGDE
ncbi:hypothetical protein [Bradyrhizobium sp. 190]|uniref:hypothetical protein n=1 Tax=Bradyrhizobium sp. 190 TaxID=2782658 RepID=UPI001FF922F7|nr:hypothetical protein [Bradyrhizobium sp. 190]